MVRSGPSHVEDGPRKEAISRRWMNIDCAKQKLLPQLDRCGSLNTVLTYAQVPPLHSPLQHWALAVQTWPGGRHVAA